MEMWKGLFKKEWKILKWVLIALVLLNIVVVIVGPPLINRAFDLPLNTFEHSLIITGAWFVFNMFVGVGVLVTSLEHEMKQQDVWLHSPASILRLVGVKAIFAAVVTVGLLVLDAILLSISFLTSDAVGTIPKFDGVLSLLSVMIAIFLNSIFVMGIGFFVWSFYRVFHSRIGKASQLLTFALFIVAIILWEKLRVAGLFKMVKGFVPIKLTSLPFYNESNSYYFTGIVPDGVVTSIGSLLFYGTLTAILFVTGSVLFEKKVRL